MARKISLIPMIFAITVSIWFFLYILTPRYLQVNYIGDTNHTITVNGIHIESFVYPNDSLLVLKEGSEVIQSWLERATLTIGILLGALGLPSLKDPKVLSRRPELAAVLCNLLLALIYYNVFMAPALKSGAHLRLSLFYIYLGSGTCLVALFLDQWKRKKGDPSENPNGKTK